MFFLSQRMSLGFEQNSAQFSGHHRKFEISSLRRKSLCRKTLWKVPDKKDCISKILFLKDGYNTLRRKVNEVERKKYLEYQIEQIAEGRAGKSWYRNQESGEKK
jgi:hypothetical protein